MTKLSFISMKPCFLYILRVIKSTTPTRSIKFDSIMCLFIGQILKKLMFLK